MSQSLIAFDTNHIKRYVFGTSKLKEICGASSLLDYLNRVETVNAAKEFQAQKIFAHGGSALFLIETEHSDQDAKDFGKAVQKRYRQMTGGGASITYAVQSIPANTVANIMQTEKVNEEICMKQILQLLRTSLRIAKDSQQADEPYHIAQPTHAFLCMCKSCGVAYAESMMSDPDDQNGRYCRICTEKRNEDEKVKQGIPRLINTVLSLARNRADQNEELKLWERILQAMNKQNTNGAPSYNLTRNIQRPQDFQAFRELGNGKGYLGLIYADANSMGKAIEEQKTLEEVREFAERIDNAVFDALGEAIKAHLRTQDELLPFDILMVGGDDIVMVTPADRALEVARTVAQHFLEFAPPQTLSVGVVLAPVAYPFNLQLKLAEDILKDAKKAGALSQIRQQDELSHNGHVSFFVVTGNTSLNYKTIHAEMCIKNQKEEFYATIRPYSLDDFTRLLNQLQEGKKLRLGRTKLYQLREAILKLNQTTTILEALALFRNWRDEERQFIRGLVQERDKHLNPQEQRQRGTLFPWYLEITKHGKRLDVYRTPLLDFIELYDFVSLQERSS